MDGQFGNEYLCGMEGESRAMLVELPLNTQLVCKMTEIGKSGYQFVDSDKYIWSWQQVLSLLLYSKQLTGFCDSQTRGPL